MYVECLPLQIFKETKLCIFWKNVDVASKSLELLNLLQDYCFWGLECCKLNEKSRARYYEHFLSFADNINQ